MANLSVEVITEILSRLPVKSALQLRSTCNWWRSLIDTIHFILFHLSKSHTTLILRHRSHLYTVNPQSLKKPLEITHPLMCYSNNIKVLGSCNNLIYISNVADIALWNPHLRKHRILPADCFNCPKSSLFAARIHGFGHDPASNDYKLVSITYFVDLHNRTFDSQVQLYTLKFDAGKNLPNMPYALYYAQTMGVLVGGALHWVITRKLEPDQPDLIITFDLTCESLHEVELPATLKGNFDMEVALLGGDQIDQLGNTETYLKKNSKNRNY
ncbi:F-box protein CPR30-like [Vigna radiata var. radiata]|uniref:F-box protein CPR30-like n=1 Tax=Vigna radiata var. radiata TaxID=3916 RepID=A0A1S3VBG4_VIGRR|nr:F-box protein CPR30-like [Vigna radiata var. radiata]